MKTYAITTKHYGLHLPIKTKYSHVWLLIEKVFLGNLCSSTKNGDTCHLEYVTLRNVCCGFNVALFSHRFKGDSDFTSDFGVLFDAPTIEFFKNETDKERREKLCSLRLHPMVPFKV